VSKAILSGHNAWVTIIRTARESDVAVLAELARAAYSGYIERIGREPAPMTADYASLVQAGLVWVAVRDDVVVGLLVLEVRPDHLLLDNIAVSHTARGLGIGRQLLGFADECARRRGLSEIRLYTNEAMTENLDYYPRHGYTETHRGIESGYRRVFFSKSL
jgi:GNAT superfamily N-acetyltransferase